MGFRFFKRMKILPGVTVNMSRGGPSLSFGPEGLKYTIGPGGQRFTAGIPGTGFYYTTDINGARQKLDQAGINAETLKGLFSKLKSGPDQDFAAGMEALAKMDNDEALRSFKAGSGTDSQFMCGYLLLGKKDYAGAEEYFRKCRLEDLGKMAAGFRDDFELQLQVTEHIHAEIALDRRGWSLALAEACQQQGKYDEAYSLLDKLWDEDQGDPVLCLAFTELVALESRSTTEQMEEICMITSQMDNDDAIDTNILYMRGYALYRLGRVEEAISQLSAAVLDVSGRPPRMILDICYLRGQLFELAGDAASGRRDFEYIYAQDPAFENVRARLGR